MDGRNTNSNSNSNKPVSKKDKKAEKQKVKAEKAATKAANADWTDNIPEEVKNNAWNYSIIIFILFMVAMSIYFQYRHEKQQRMSVATEENEENYYEILGVEANADLPTIRKQYKELTKIWHPDKNPGCKPCHEKFLQISKAYEILSDEVKRGEMDSKGGKSIFGSQPQILNARNYHHLVEESNDFWVLLIYEGTRGNKYNSYVAEVWDEIASKYKHIVKFGVIDVLQNENILHFLPYKFQYYPNIITYLHGEGSELFQNMESFSVKTFASFIEDSFISRVNQINESGLNYFIKKTENQPHEVKNIKYEDIDINLFILSSKTYVDLVAKDFAKNYHHSLQIHQNEMGNFDTFLKKLNSKGDKRVYILYNKIVSEQNKIILKNVLKPLPTIFKPNSNISQRLQVAFNIVKSLILQRIYKNNYTKHCINKVFVGGEDLNVRNENEMKINMCVILLEHSNDINESTMNSVFYQSLQGNFNKRVERASNPQLAKNNEEYLITVNFGVTNLEKNKRLFKLYNEFIQEKKVVVPKGKSKLLFLVNDTQEKFSFKFFTDETQMNDFLQEFDKSDSYEDYSFSFDHFINYGITEIKEIFNEEKIFSIERIFTTAIYSQMQSTYIFSFILIFIANCFFKIQNLTLYAIGTSFIVCLLWNIFNSLNF